MARRHTNELVQENIQVLWYGNTTSMVLMTENDLQFNSAEVAKNEYIFFVCVYVCLFVVNKHKNIDEQKHM